MKIGLIGYGGVGKAFVRLLEMQKSVLEKEGLHIEVDYIVDCGGGIYQPGGIDLPSLIEFTASQGNLTDFIGGSTSLTVWDMATDSDIDLAVIMTPTNKETGQPGLAYTGALLQEGKHVVISDKGPVMLAYHRLKEMARKSGVQLGIGCTTGGALPSVNGGIMDMAGAEITSIEGVLNGTTNFILKYMEEEGCEYEAALKEAQRCGIAETNPVLDVEGWDTAGKLLILTNVLMGEDKTLADIKVEGITHLTAEAVRSAAERGCKYKLVGRTCRTESGLSMEVGPREIPSNHLLYAVDGKNKAVRYSSDTLGELMIMGGASGVIPAAASILRDIVNIHRGYRF